MRIIITHRNTDCNTVIEILSQQFESNISLDCGWLPHVASLCPDKPGMNDAELIPVFRQVRDEIRVFRFLGAVV